MTITQPLTTSTNSPKTKVTDWKKFKPYFLVAPQTLVFLLFLVLPILAIFIVSFWTFNGYTMVPTFTLNNYLTIFTSKVFLSTYVNTIKFAAIVWLLTLAIAYPVAYFLAFHIKSLKWQTILFLVCTVPFLTSNIIRMISWIPFLGREGILNGLLMGLHLTDQPLEMFLFSDFAVLLAMVHLYTLYMVAPTFNSMMRIDRSLIAAAEDAGASAWQIQKEIIFPLSSPGIAIGSIFVVTLVMGEFATVRLMSGGQTSSVGYLIKTLIGSLQYPMAAANAIVLLAVTLLIVFGILRAVDIRKEL
ncbi:ABC transporter permease [Kamptonema animale CS-326]|jgi:putative spermidine/putrescine transport system permease protein|uniref:ABC transporter permease n=1 Tax=Kamptonema animale TaxID=92934 RepID=UPI00232CB0E4|nr:ABC transporter permease [Kamptonema animale]MDB9511572.1 ABC transporter permease [Kamptonema animale CS-326]